MLETIVVVAIVAVAAVLAGRSPCRTVAGKNGGCGCAGNCRDCTFKNPVETYQRRDDDR